MKIWLVCRLILSKKKKNSNFTLVNWTYAREWSLSEDELRSITSEHSAKKRWSCGEVGSALIEYLNGRNGKRPEEVKEYSGIPWFTTHPAEKNYIGRPRIKRSKNCSCWIRAIILGKLVADSFLACRANHKSWIIVSLCLCRRM